VQPPAHCVIGASVATRDLDLSLDRKSRVSAVRALAYRITLVLFLIAIAVAVHWLDRDGLRDNVDGHISFLDVLYFTMITITTVGFGDITPVTPEARAFDTFVVTPIRIFVWLIFLGTAYDFLLKRSWARWRMAMIQKSLTQHVVIVGFGREGHAAFAEVVARGTPAEQVVVIECDADRLALARAAGATVLLGDATRDAVIEAVHIERSRALIVAAGRDDTSILIVLTARRFAPDIPISIVIDSADNEPLAHQAGATTVINPGALSGLLLAGSTRGAHVADYFADLAASGGAVQLRERDVRDDEVGRPIGAIRTGLGVRIVRDDVAHCFSSAESQSLRKGDRLIEIVPNGAQAAA
jgi:voltage-gated potassium channel